MFQQVVNILWYNAYQNTFFFCGVGSISLGENVLVNICIQKMKNISLLGQEFFSEQKKYRSSIVRVMFF
ncbi:hypothetical protein PHYBLDRAFT_158732, partial [Phycomyces blakesleeanus NRRL 1555(-)]